MKRRIFKLVLFLLLGAIINVAVAWGCAIWIEEPFHRLQACGVHRSRNDGAKLYVEMYNTFGTTVYQVTPNMIPPVDEWGLSADLYSLLSQWFKDEFELPATIESRVHKADASREVVLRGWPFRSTCYEVAWVEGWKTQGALEVSLRPFQRRRLPLEFLWPGFAINTIFYAAILWLLFAAPFAVRRRIRGHRGRCIACGYDLRGRASENKLCPECGVSASKLS